MLIGRGRTGRPVEHRRWAASPSPSSLVAVATLVGLVALTSNWAQRSALDTETWVETSRELLEDEAIRREVAAQIARPDGRAGRPGAEAAIAAALARPEVEALWAAANEQTHALLVAVVDESAAAGSLGTEGDGEPARCST